MKEFLNMDCMEGMKVTPDNFYDLAIVDPPYGIDLANMNMGLGEGKKNCKIQNRKWVNKNWDQNAPSKEYFTELFRVSRDQIIWGGNYFDLPPCYGFVIWDKESPEGMSFSDCEFAWHSFKKVAKMFKYSTYKGKKVKIHPTQKPVQLYKWLLKNYATCTKCNDEADFIMNKIVNENMYAVPCDKCKGIPAKILDTHTGSGSSLIAFEDFGCSYTGYEIDKDYFDAATKRLKQHTDQLTIF